MTDINTTITETTIIGQIESSVNIISTLSNTEINVEIQTGNEVQIVGQLNSGTTIEAIVTNGAKGDSFTYDDFTSEQLEDLKVSDVNDLIIYVDDKYSLPAIGDSNYVYITKDEYAMYLWDSVNIIYQVLGMSSTEFNTLTGGNATTNFETE
jgi:rRNA processing protein Krr1/Pno1